MALINCPECGKEISDKAVCCPQCGKPTVKKKKSYILEIIAFLFIVFCIAFCWKIQDHRTPEERAQEKLDNECKDAAAMRDELTFRANALIFKINSESQTPYGQARAFRDLVKLFPELNKTTYDEFKRLPLNEQQKSINRIMEKGKI